MTGTILMLNAAEQRLQFGLARGGGLVFWQDWAAASRGVELLAPLLADALRRLEDVVDGGGGVSAIGRIACVTGPGGFTGLRLALATASALHHALHVPLAGINYLELLAEGSPALPGQAVRVLTHARRDLVYRQDFQRRPGEDGGVVPLGDPGVAQLHEAWNDMPVVSAYPPVVIGSGLNRHPELLERAAPAVPVPGRHDQPSPEAFVRLAGRAVYGEAGLAPVYLRGSEAEDNLELLAERRGDDPGQARAQLRRLLGRAPADMALPQR